MGLEPAFDQISNHSAVDTWFDDDDDNVAHASPFKQDCDHTHTESQHTGNDTGLINM
jgi:hypothetical protein